jgi:hypothetical protein
MSVIGARAENIYSFRVFQSGQLVSVLARANFAKIVWTINRRAVLSKGFIAAIRLANGNRDVLDYLFLPTSEMTGPKIRFTAARLDRFEGHLFLRHRLAWQ